jgi:excisionase family DNA binding protein
MAESARGHHLACVAPGKKAGKEAARVRTKQRGIEPVAPIVGEGVMPGLLTVEQACNYLKLSRTTLFNLLGAGTLRAVHHGRRRLVPVAELNRYIERLLADEYGDDLPAA